VKAAVDVTTAITHHNPETMQTSEFFARVAFRVVHDSLPPKEAIKSVARFSGKFIKDKVLQALRKVKESNDEDSELYGDEFIDDKALTSMARVLDIKKKGKVKIGKASPCEGTLPGAVYFICKYNDLSKAAAANAMVGGDSAARSIPIGMVLGAHQGEEAIPKHWKDELKVYESASEKLEKLPLLDPYHKVHGHHDGLYGTRGNEL
jgi:ADP-ribosylglycohydrolase